MEIGDESHLRANTPETRPGGPAAPPELPQHVFRREGEYWTIASGNRLARIRHSKGIEYIAQLLARPGARVSVDEILAGEPTVSVEPASSEHTAADADRMRIRVTKAIRLAIRRIRKSDPRTAELLDETIRTGRCCSYHPRPWDPPAWDVHGISRG